MCPPHEVACFAVVTVSDCFHFGPNLETQCLGQSPPALRNRMRRRHCDSCYCSCTNTDVVCTEERRPEFVETAPTARGDTLEVF